MRLPVRAATVIGSMNELNAGLNRPALEISPLCQPFGRPSSWSMNWTSRSTYGAAAARSAASATNRACETHETPFSSGGFVS